MATHTAEPPEATRSERTALEWVSGVAEPSRAQTAKFTLLEQALALDPDNPAVLKEVGILQSDSDDNGAARRSFERLVELRDSPGARFLLGSTCNRLGDWEAALASLEAAVEREGGSSDMYRELGTALDGLGRREVALEAYRESTRLGPDSSAAYERLGRLLFRMGRYDEADLAFRTMAEIGDDPTVAMASQLVVARAAGGESEEALAGRVREETRTVALDPPDRYASMAEFNSAIERQLLSLPRVFEPDRKATKHGWQVRHLHAVTEGPVSELLACVKDAVQAYVDDRPGDDDHPFLGSPPARVRLSAWSVLMKEKGQELAHIHPGGWLSGVYYVKIPPTINESSESHAGWIEFGRPTQEWEAPFESPLERRLPMEGTAILFPSYLYHNTVPHRGEDLRICIAFDVMPEPER